MATAKLTLIGLYNYDETLFDGIALPDYFDRSVLVNRILLAGGEFGVLYPAADSLKNFIKVWSDKNQRWFVRLAVLMEKEYEPLENYNRVEHWNDHGTSENESSYDNDATDEGKVSAYNSNQYEPRDLSISNQTGSGKGSNEFDTIRDGYARGNIGVMSSQDMFKQELDVIDISPYDLIAGDFINEFCIKIY